jgi:hypothetical protein
MQLSVRGLVHSADEVQVQTPGGPPVQVLPRPVPVAMQSALDMHAWQVPLQYGLLAVQLRPLTQAAQLCEVIVSQTLLAHCRSLVQGVPLGSDAAHLFEALQNCPLVHCTSWLQVVPQSEGVAQSKPPGQLNIAGQVRVEPSHMPVWLAEPHWPTQVPGELEHVAGPPPHGVNTGFGPHAPATQVAHAPVQLVCGSVPSLTAPQVPSAPLALSAAVHAWQVPLHAMLQQTPSAQWPLVHS